ncbi:unnamed protein product [Lactuca saligna]|uniref:MCM OB domain-containing protein n=1 Tax=Lactuca saligna TaxID=75948 RepID=A0AA35Y628_LACSI|nr:unnamed protein product [Lactuca saligna]
MRLQLPKDSVLCSMLLNKIDPGVIAPISYRFRAFLVQGAHIANGGPVSDFDERWITFTAMEIVESHNSPAQNAVILVFNRTVESGLQKHQLGPRQIHLNKMIRIRGDVTQRSGVFSQLQQVKYDCNKCGTVLGPFIQNSYSKVKVGSCPKCQSKRPFTINIEQPNMQSKLQNEGLESKQFWEILDGKSKYPSQKIARDVDSDPHLFTCTFSKGDLKVTEIYNFSQDDLMTEDIFILDCHSNIFFSYKKTLAYEDASEAGNQLELSFYENLLELLELTMSSNTAETVKRAKELMELGVYPTVLMSQMATLIMDIIAGTYQVIEASADSLFDGRSSSESIRDTGAVASSRAAEIGLDILAQTIQTSIVFTLEEDPRVLFNALAVFALREINLSKVTFSTTTFYLSR